MSWLPFARRLSASSAAKILAAALCEYPTWLEKPLGESAVLQETFVYVNMFASCWFQELQSRCYRFMYVCLLLSVCLTVAKYVKKQGRQKSFL